MPLSRIVPRGQVYAFEAQPAFARTLRLLVRLTLSRNVRVYTRAVLDRSDSIHLVTHDQSGRALGGLTHLEGLDGKVLEGEPVPGVTLDEALGNVSGRIRFIKLDIEGSELMALEGAVDLVKRHRPICFAEVNDRYCQRYGYRAEQVFDYFSRRGYHAFTAEAKPTPIVSGDYPGVGNVWFVPRDDPALGAFGA